MWRIHVVENTLKISDKVAQQLFKAQCGEGDEGDIWYSQESIRHSDDQTVSFNGDHYEHMDWLGQRDDLVAVLKKNKVKGDVCFADLEGGSGPSFWGYRFDGKGGMSRLDGKVVWDTEKPKAKKTR